MNNLNNRIVSEAELNCILFSQGTPLNPYELYISSLQRSQHDKTTLDGKPLPGNERHHILPKHAGGSNRKDNIVVCSVKEHIIAHWLRYQVVGDLRDNIAYKMRVGETNEAYQLKIQLVKEARQRDREQKRFMFDSDWQSMQGSKGGLLGGAANTEAQFLARQKVGQTYGRQTGISNQGNDLVAFIECYSIWAYDTTYSAPLPGQRRKYKKTITPESEVFYLVEPKQAFKDVVDVLNTYSNDAIQKPSSFHKVIYGYRRQMYGWRIVNTLIRSEVKEGIADFYQQNPYVALIFEEAFMIAEEFE